jgi:hypothetical protein
MGVYIYRSIRKIGAREKTNESYQW